MGDDDDEYEAQFRARIREDIQDVFEHADWSNYDAEDPNDEGMEPSEYAYSRAIPPPYARIFPRELGGTRGIQSNRQRMRNLTRRLEQALRITHNGIRTHRYRRFHRIMEQEIKRAKSHIMTFTLSGANEGG